MNRRKSHHIFVIVISIVLCLMLGCLSIIIIQPALSQWYIDLNKPFYSPPNWFFTPVWILFYTFMGWAVGRVWFFGRRHRWGQTALYHFGAQIIFNGLWSLVFFGLKNPLWALVVIFILWILVERTIFWFRLVDQKASVMLYPYLAWISFSILLNLSIVVLN
jgi:tryptophan-rich sensory protein